MASRLMSLLTRSSIYRLSSYPPNATAIPILATSQWRRGLTTDSKEYDNEYFDNLVKDKKVVLFMKGDPSAPMCGFSRLVVQILQMHGVDTYDHHDVLQDINFKEQLKNYSKWPTFPQLYVNGELLGGADIILQLHQNGELIEELKKIGHKSVLLDKTN